MKSPHLFCGNHGIIVKLYLLIGFHPTGQSARRDSLLLVQLTLCLPIVVQTHDAFPELFRVSRGFFGQLLSNSLSNPLRKVSREESGNDRGVSRLVSIPLRKVSRTDVSCCLITPIVVSIPLRKVSRLHVLLEVPPEYFVSIPLRKVSRAVVAVEAVRGLGEFPFHQGRFQGLVDAFSPLQQSRFHSTKTC